MSKIINQMEAKERIFKDTNWDCFIAEVELDEDNRLKLSIFGDSKLKDKYIKKREIEILKVLNCIYVTLAKKILFREIQNTKNNNEEIPVKAPNLYQILKTKTRIEFWYIKRRSKNTKKYLLTWKILIEQEMSDEEMCVLLTHIISSLMK